MISTKRRKTFLPPLVLASLLSLLTLTKHLTALAQGPTLHLDKAGSIDTGELDLLHPTGLAYSPADNIFFVSPANTTSATLTTLSPFENLIGQVTIPAKVDSLNLTFDPRTRGLLLFDFAANDLLEIKIGPLGLPDPATVTRIEAQLFGLQQPQGMTFDPVGRLFILDQPGPRLVRIQPDLTPGLDSATALKQGQVSQVDLSALGLGNIRGLAFNPANGHLYLLNPASQSLYELTETGQWVTTFDLSSFRLNDPQGLVFGPSRDTTDDPLLINLYIASSGLAVQSGQNPLPGEIIELTFKESALDALVVDMQATLVRTTLTSQFSPPSPDPSGLAYLTSSNTLLISDGEVEEMSIFAGKNLFQTSLSGSLVGTFTTLPFSDEPAGVAYNPFNQHLFFSDDTDQ
jgi:DNA-binding beta-propeller fold protein YncE